MNTPTRNDLAAACGVMLRKRLRYFILSWTIVFATGANVPISAQIAGKFEDPNTLLETQLQPSWKNLIVVIHGWNPDGYANPYSADPWPQLLSNLDDATKQSNLDPATSLPTWHVVAYNWNQDAHTGWVISEDGSVTENAVTAAANAVSQGPLIASAIASKIPGLRQVHFIAHSAGAWAAQNAFVRFFGDCRVIRGRV